MHGPLSLRLVSDDWSAQLYATIARGIEGTLSGVKRTWLLALRTSAFDPKQTLEPPFQYPSLSRYDLAPEHRGGNATPGFHHASGKCRGLAAANRGCTVGGAGYRFAWQFVER